MGNYYPLTVIEASLNGLLHIEDVVFPFPCLVDRCSDMLHRDEGICVEDTVGKKFLKGEYLYEGVLISNLIDLKGVLYLFKECVSALPLVATKRNDCYQALFEDGMSFKGIKEIIIGEMAQKNN